MTHIYRKMIYNLARTLRPLFSQLMKSSKLETWAYNNYSYKLVALFLRLHWEAKPFSERNYEKYHEEYWSTIGLKRWQQLDNYDYSDFERQLKSILEQQEIESVLDLGCGRGHNLAFLSHHSPHLKLYGIDGARPMVDDTRKKVPSAHVTHGFYGPDNKDLTDFEFDLVIVRSSLTYVPEESIAGILKWIFSKAKKAVLISEPSGFFDKEQPLEWKRISIDENTYQRSYDHTYIRKYDGYQLHESMGFELISIELTDKKRQRSYLFLKENKRKL